MHSVLVIDDDAALIKSVQQQLSHAGYDVHTAAGGRPGLEKLKGHCFDMTLVDLVMPDIDGLTVLDYAVRNARSRSVIVTSDNQSVPMAVDAMRAGAADFIAKPFEGRSLQSSIARALGEAPNPDSLSGWRKQYAPGLVGDDPKTLQTLSMVQRVAATDCDVMITGASGTGKELVARCIHLASLRHKHPFVAINCAAIPKDLMESEIFGHARGAFTGATERRIGKFEAAGNGTLFLDEAGEMDLTLQGKLLRVIQEREVTPVGDSRTFKVDVRLISATNQDLHQLCQDKQFREDLYYRLNVIPIHIPSLAERPQDIPLLANHFIARASRRHNRRTTGLDAGAREAFCIYDWPGNVRELQNIVERVVVLKSNDGLITRSDLPPQLLQPRRAVMVGDLRLPENGLDINETLTAVETRLTLEALERACGNKAKAAELLGLKRTTLVERLKKLSLLEMG